MLDVVVLNDQQEELTGKDAELVKKVLASAADFMKLDHDYEMSVNFVDDKKIHEINKEYRNTDRATDVISFALEEADRIHIDGVPEELGDLFISLDHAQAQAEEYGHSYERELAYLAVHGFLHLLGYDHTKSQAAEDEMFGLQDKILERYGLTR
ncbi:Endoribonuclease YbeY {ECO:0000255/HAMAP-Rule:MF_00009} [Oenococcus sicerae]|nr:Endoribonuclease YbeY {ECO:0000255/HAMAP-Rule:MF_00009} [Oenococcus sicerae]